MGGQNGNSRLDVKVRGNAHQLLEKYKMMARDAHQAGDRVAAEYYLQHSDHYFRILNDSRMRAEEARARRNVFDALDEGDDDDAQDAVETTDQRAPRDEQRFEQRGADRAPPERREHRHPARSQPEAPREQPRFERDEGGQRLILRLPEAEPVAPAPVVAPTVAPTVAPAPVEQPLSDGEAALVAFGGRRRPGRPRSTPAPEPASEAGPAVEAQADQAAEAAEGAEPPRRRRGRPRKSEAVPAAD
jgi:hypothetical protein